jgi:hypothetical protein
MFDALHPARHEIISYSEYLKFALSLNHIKPNDAPPARCPVCKRNMQVRAGQTKGDGHFYHVDNLFCPTKDPSRRPYINLMPAHPSAASAQANRAFAEQSIEKIYTRVKSITPCLDFKEFLEILKEAKRLNIYGYANASGEYLPYIYVTLINFLPSKSYNKSRKLKFCFFYEEKIKSYEELWIDRGFNSSLYRISYSSNITQKITEIETSLDYLTETPTTMTSKQKQWCLDIL